MRDTTDVMDGKVILGYQGTLGHQLAQLFPGAVLWDREEVDVMDFARLEGRLRQLNPAPAVVVNCVAFNDVDGAEDRPDAAFALNAEYVGRLASLTNEMNALLVHYSTNYIFDGVGGEFAEEDKPNPLSAYGKSKRRGEELALQNASRCYVVRTAVLFGRKGRSVLSKRSFVDVMLDLSARTDTIRAVADEVNSITYAPDLARATKALIGSGAATGIYHLTNSGHASWFEFAGEIFRLTGRRINLEPVPSSAFPRKAHRPAVAVLLNKKTAPLRSWQAALTEYLEELGVAKPTDVAQGRTL
ncbi:MAG: dTDP-4-dehydrorhamnose reductase [Bryobacteraceae bacterium]